jgi:hypothetical protein
MADKNQSGPKKTNHPQDQQSTAAKPVHTRDTTITGSGDLNIAFRVQAFKAPSSNLQAPEKIQSPTFNWTSSPLSSRVKRNGIEESRGMNCGFCNEIPRLRSE